MVKEPTDLDRALQAADSGEAYGWPIVARVLADEYRELRAAVRELAASYEHGQISGDLLSVRLLNLVRGA